VRERAGGVDAVLVFGGPPCTAYSSACADTSRFPARYRCKRADEAYYAALAERAAAVQALKQLRTSGAAASALEQAGQRVREAEQELAALKAASEEATAAAKQEAIEDTARLHDSDALVKSFLGLYKSVEAEANALGRPGFLGMENPYSTRPRGLWNR